MPGKVQKALESLISHISRSDKGIARIVRGQGELGHRAAPARGGNHDAKIGARIDFGERIEMGGKKYRRYKFQLNSDADDATLKKLAAKDSHKVYSTADVEIKET